MSAIYRKSLKGIDEVAFKATGLPLRLVSYLLSVDGEASVDQLAARYQHLPSMQAVLQGLAEQGFLEVAGTAANVVDIGQMRVGNGANVGGGLGGGMGQVQPQYQPQQQQPQQQMQSAQQPMYAPQQPMYAPQQQPPSYAPAPAGAFPEMESYKSNMMRDVSALLGTDAAPVINKIQACRTKEELFTVMMGIKKIIVIYNDRNAADKFGARYNQLSM